MKYLIHTCPKREWYVNDHLIPLLTEQGITKNDIKVWNDKNKVGNLESFVASCEWIGKNYDLKESTWHLQDDIVVSKRFVEEAEKPYSGLKNGFCNEIFDGERTNYIGEITSNGMWFSFQCILIPNKVAAEFAKWFREECIPQGLYPEYVESGRCDDSIFREWVMEHLSIPAMNVFPNIADHIDYLIGGTACGTRKVNDTRKAYWRDQYLDDAVSELEKRLAKKKKEELREYVDSSQ